MGRGNLTVLRFSEVAYKELKQCFAFSILFKAIQKTFPEKIRVSNLEETGYVYFDYLNKNERDYLTCLLWGFFAAFRIETEGAFTLSKDEK